MIKDKLQQKLSFLKMLIYNRQNNAKKNTIIFAKSNKHTIFAAPKIKGRLCSSAGRALPF